MNLGLGGPSPSGVVMASGKVEKKKIKGSGIGFKEAKQAICLLAGGNSNLSVKKGGREL